MADFKKLTDREIDRFLKSNQHGILSFAGDKPYALPMGYMYKRKTILLGLATAGKKMKYLKKLEPSARLTPLQGKFGIAWDYDTTPLQEELGFRPQYTMEAGILKTFNIYRERAGKSPVSS